MLPPNSSPSCCSQFSQFLLGPQDIARQHWKQVFASDLVYTRRISHFIWGALESIPLANHLAVYAENYYNDYFAWKRLIGSWEDAPILDMTIDSAKDLDLTRLASDMVSTFMQAIDAEGRPVFLFKTSAIDPTRICLVLFSDRTCCWKINRSNYEKGFYEEKYRGKPYVKSILQACPELQTYLEGITKPSRHNSGVLRVAPVTRRVAAKSTQGSTS